MHGAGKAVIGIILLVIGLAMFADEWGYHTFVGSVHWWTDFLHLLAGAVPILLIVIGLFVVWLELDQQKVKAK